MKTCFKWASALAMSAFLLASCSVSKMRDESATIEPGKSNLTCFVELKNGSVRQFSSLRLVTSPFAAPHLLANGKEKIQSAAIRAYQTEKLYAVTQEIFVDNLRSKSAVETLPGFASRIVDGNITVYCKKYYNGRATAEQLFVQKDGGEIFAFTPELLESLLKDNIEAKELFKKTRKITPASKRVSAVAALYNKHNLFTKNS